MNEPPTERVPHPAAAPAVAALQRLIDAAGNDHDRDLLRVALDAVESAYPAPQSPPQSLRERDNRGWPVLPPYQPKRGTM